MISAPKPQPDGTLSYRVQSPYQQAETQIHVLIPENEPQGGMCRDSVRTPG
jgi:hypothetical protein